jgi:hypothetical protein
MGSNPIDLIRDHLNWMRDRVDKDIELREGHHGHAASREERAADSARRKDQADYDADINRVRREHLRGLQATDVDDPSRFVDLLASTVEKLHPSKHETFGAVFQPFTETYLASLGESADAKAKRAMTIDAAAVLTSALNSSVKS